MFRTLHTLVLTAGLLASANFAFAQDPVTQRPGQTQPTQPAPVVQKQTPTAAAQPLVTLEGREEWGENGSLVFHLYQDRSVVMIDATQKPVKGSVKAEGNCMSFRFGNCVYEATEKDNVLTGRARYVSGKSAGQSWNFRVSLRNPFLGRTFAGRETLANYGAVSFRFLDPTTVEMTDTQSVTRGTYRHNGVQVVMTFGQTVYTGTLQNGSLIGTARDPNHNWTFEVAASK